MRRPPFGGFWLGFVGNFVTGFINNWLNQWMFTGEVDWDQAFKTGALTSLSGLATAGATNLLFGKYLTAFGKQITSSAFGQALGFSPAYGSLNPSGIPHADEAGCFVYDTGGVCIAR